jgi:hypothetical protein
MAWGDRSGVKSLGFQTLRLFAGATSLTFPAGTEYALITVEGGPARWRDDGTNPTTDTGMNLAVSGEPFVYYPAGAALSSMFLIQGSATTSVVNVTYYGRS